MTDDEYLQAVLRDQTLDPKGPELKELREHRKRVEKLLREEFGDYDPTIVYAGSKKKHTMIKESYDLDMTCYFAHDETGPGETLKEIYDNVEERLRKDYLTERKASAIRLKDLAQDTYGTDFHIDVVPGHFFDEDEADVWLHQNTGKKDRLKTNLEIHVAHIRDSGVRDAIRLMKLWRVRNAVGIKTFVLELLVIDLLKDKKKKPLSAQLRHVLEQFRDNADEFAVEDPANPIGNDLSEELNDTVKANLSATANQTLETIDNEGWEGVFGPVEKHEEDRTEALKRVAISVPSLARHQPWCHER